MDLDKIKALIDMMAKSDMAELEFAENGWTLRLSRAPKVTSQAAETSPGPTHAFKHMPPVLVSVEGARIRSSAASADVQAPLSGVLHLTPAPGRPPFVTPGQAIKAGTTVCVIEAMKVFNEVRAARDGTVEAIHVASGVEVDAGQALMRIA